jgi:transcription elongation GreA/GreB family factor
VSQDVKRNNELMQSETSKREENKEAMVDRDFHDISSSAFYEEALMDDRGNDGDYGEFQDAGRNNELVPYD